MELFLKKIQTHRRLVSFIQIYFYKNMQNITNEETSKGKKYDKTIQSYFPWKRYESNYFPSSFCMKTGLIEGKLNSNQW